MTQQTKGRLAGYLERKAYEIERLRDRIWNAEIIQKNLDETKRYTDNELRIQCTNSQYIQCTPSFVESSLWKKLGEADILIRKHEGYVKEWNTISREFDEIRRKIIDRTMTEEEYESLDNSSIEEIVEGILQRAPPF